MYDDDPLWQRGPHTRKYLLTYLLTTYLLTYLQREDRVPLAREKQLRHQHLRAEQCRAQHEPAHPRVEGEPPQPWAAVPAGAATGGWLGLGLG